jgi:TBCC domain-containing protein 1
MTMVTNILKLEDLVNLKYLQKCVTIKDKSVTNKHIKIINCEDSYIYINSNVQTFRMQNCINCIVFVAAVGKISSIDKCENCQISVATNFLRVSNSIDTTIYSYVTQEPILFGDNRGLILAPHNVGYNDFMQFLKFAKIHLSSVYINNWGKPIIMNKEEKEMFEIMLPKDYMRMVVPFNSDNCGLNLSPKEYYDVIKEREETMNSIKAMIKDAKLLEEQEKALHVAIQGYFRDWLVSSGNIKNISELVKMIDINNPTSDN